MPETLIVNGVPFQYPSPGDGPGWGQAATDWATEVTDVLADLQSATDIIQKSFTINNNVTSFTDIAGLNFNTGLVRAAVINYSIYRTSTGSPSGNSETGTIQIVYDNLASSGNKWVVAVGPVSGNSGVTFNITDTGQFQYKSSDLGSGHSGTMRFRAKTLST